MSAVASEVKVGRKKTSEVRKNGALIRVSEASRERAALAAHLSGMSLADYATAVLARIAEDDIQREASKLVTPKSRARKPADN